MNSKLFGASLLTASVLLASASQVNASGYIFSDLGALGGFHSTATAINNVGQIVGSSTFPSSIGFHATLWNDGGQVTDLGTLGGDATYAYANGINDSGQVVGWGLTADNKHVLPITWHGTTMTTLNTFGQGGFAYGINSTGQIVGSSGGSAALWNGTTLTTLDGGGIYAINDAGVMVGSAGLRGPGAARWDDATLTQLDSLPDSQFSTANAINNSGQIVGYDSVGIGSDNMAHAVMWSGTTETVLDPLYAAGPYSGGSSFAFGNNDAGQVVGASLTTDSGTYHATIWNGTTPTDLNSYLDAATVDAGWVLNYAHDINNSGWIVGFATNNRLGIGGHAFVLADHAYVTFFPTVLPPVPVPVPVPEPETYALFMAGLGLMGFIARRRKNDQA